VRSPSTNQSSPAPGSRHHGLVTGCGGVVGWDACYGVFALRAGNEPLATIIPSGWKHQRSLRWQVRVATRAVCHA